MSEEPEQQIREQPRWDAPNRQSVGLDPGWVEDNQGNPPPPAVAPQPLAVDELDGLTKADLLEHAQGLGLEVNDSMTKAEIRAAIEEAS